MYICLSVSERITTKYRYTARRTMMEISFELDGEPEHMAKVVVKAVREQDPDTEVDLDNEAKKAFVQHLLQQYVKLVN